MENSFDKTELFGKAFQEKVIALLVSSQDFISSIYEGLESTYFSSESHKIIVDKVISLYKKYNIYPSREALAIECNTISNQVLQIQVTEDLAKIYKTVREMHDGEIIKDQFVSFCRNQQIKNAILKSVDLLQDSRYDDISDLITKAVRVGEAKNIGLDYKKDIEARFRTESRNAIPFPWEQFNFLTQGGFGEGDLVLIFGSPGGGKSWVVCNMGAHALLKGKNVVHYTLELGDVYTSKRYDSILTGIDSKDLQYNRQKVEKTMHDIEGELVIKEFTPKKANVGTIKSHLHQLQANNGFKPDVIIIDYIDYLKSNKNRENKKDEIDDIYLEVKALAKELNIPIISPSQANRTGAKSDILEGDNAAGSYDKIMIADIIISLARSKDDKVDGTGRFHFIKNRYGQDGLTYNAKINMNTGRMVILNNVDDAQPKQVPTMHDIFAKNMGSSEITSFKFRQDPEQSPF
jgi:replicative DNA helicase